MDTLPNELLLNIFQHLDFWDLRVTLPSLCRRFHEMLRGPSSESLPSSLNKIIFRGYRTNARMGANYTAHPLFKLLKYRFTRSRGSILIDNNTKLVNHEFKNDNATNPPVSTAVLHIRNQHRRVRGTGKGGSVTVMDVMDAFVGMSEAGLFPDICQIDGSQMAISEAHWTHDDDPEADGGMVHLAVKVKVADGTLDEYRQRLGREFFGPQRTREERS